MDGILDSQVVLKSSALWYPSGGKSWVIYRRDSKGGTTSTTTTFSIFRLGKGEELSGE